MASPSQGWQTHISYSHSLTVSSSPVLYDFGLWEKTRGTNINTERTYKLNKERLLQQLGLQYCTYSTSLYTRLVMFFYFWLLLFTDFIFIIFLLIFFSTFYIYFMWFYFSQVNFVWGVHFSQVNIDGFLFLVCTDIGGTCCFLVH